jgi:hypothetical protein
MANETPSARDILSAFIADAASGKHNGDDGALAAVLLKHLLLQGGFKIVSREPNSQMMSAGALTTTPDEVWREMWDAASTYDLEESENYVPA